MSKIFVNENGTNFIEQTQYSLDDRNGSAIWGDFDAHEIFDKLEGELHVKPCKVGFAVADANLVASRSPFRKGQDCFFLAVPTVCIHCLSVCTVRVLSCRFHGSSLWYMFIVHYMCIVHKCFKCESQERFADLRKRGPGHGGHEPPRGCAKWKWKLPSLPAFPLQKPLVNNHLTNPPPHVTITQGGQYADVQVRL